VPHSLSRVLYGVQSESAAYEGTLALLRVCDAVLLLPNWEQSMGARVERCEAISRRMPVFHGVAEVRAWLDKEGP